MMEFIRKNTLGPINISFLKSIYDNVVSEKLPLMGLWAKRTVESLQADDADSTGHRDLRVLANGTCRWEYPRSNSAERIEAFIYLSRKLQDKSYFDMAVRYADCMIDDPVRGIYQGDEEDGVGQVWYWPDFGLYMTNYTMRIPSAMLLLSKETGSDKYSRVAEIAGSQLIRSQQLTKTGILREGWKPKRYPEGIAVDTEKIQTHLSNFKINSRIGYVAVAFADMYKATGKQIYKDSLEYFVKDFKKYQNPNGSFPEDIRFDKIEVHSARVKGHFHGYILNGIAKAAYLMPEIGELREVAVRLADYIVHQYRQSWGHPYINLHDKAEGAESGIWHSSSPEIIAGLAWLGKVTGNDVYTQVAYLTAIDAMIRVFDCPQEPDLHGAFPLWLNKNIDPNQQTGPYVGGWFHFGLILGLNAIEETTIKKKGHPHNA